MDLRFQNRKLGSAHGERAGDHHSADQVDRYQLDCALDERGSRVDQDGGEGGATGEKLVRGQVGSFCRG